jgi:DNA helicase II / ATP-dependent DNA helicase PcrA
MILQPRSAPRDFNEIGRAPPYRRRRPRFIASQRQLERLYDYAAVRIADLEQIAAGYVTRERFLTELTLDPPNASGAESGAARLHEDYLIV